MAISDRNWTTTTIHTMALAFLLAERQKYGTQIDQYAHVLDTPDLEDPFENFLRLRLLNIFRRWVIGEIPPDTSWFTVSGVPTSDLSELHVIAHDGWEADAQDQNQLLDVAKRKPLALTGDPAKWPSPIVWGHSRQGPFTIVEGNHRLTALASTSPMPDCKLTLIVGISPTLCSLHFADPANRLLRDLFFPANIGFVS